MIWNPDLNNEEYSNPIIYTDYSDPDAIRVGDDYYLTASSFNNVPGLPVLHSRDLIHWSLISYALKVLPDESYNSVRHGCGVWAPAIRYHDNKFYICFPMPDEGLYMVTAEKAEGPWSEPIQIYKGKGFIDPCPFWDEDGKAYLVNAVAKSRIGYKSVLYVSELSNDGCKLLNQPVKIYDGSLDGNDTCEGPKLYKRNGFYYILAPAGGVKCGWQLALRSKNIYGPYEVKKIMYQGKTGINGPHQGAWVQTAEGDDWFLHFQDVFAAGRITHLQPMKWIDDWPIIGEPVLKSVKPVIRHELIEDLHEKPLPWQWNANPCKEMQNSVLSEDYIELNAVYNDKDISVCDFPNIILRKWEAPEFEVTGVIDLSDVTENVRCGIVSLGMEYLSLEIIVKDNELHIDKITGNIGGSETNENVLKINKITHNLSFSIKVSPINDVTAISPKPEYSIGMEFQVLHPEEEVTISISDSDNNLLVQEQILAKAGRWVGCKYGFYCTANEKGFKKTNSFKLNSVLVK